MLASIDSLSGIGSRGSVLQGGLPRCRRMGEDEGRWSRCAPLLRPQRLVRRSSYVPADLGCPFSSLQGARSHAQRTQQNNTDPDGQHRKRDGNEYEAYRSQREAEAAARRGQHHDGTRSTANRPSPNPKRVARHSVSLVRERSSTSITARRARPCQYSHSIGSGRNICCPQSWRAAKFLMQVSEHPTDLFAGPAAVDPVFLSQGDGFGIVVAVVAASRNLSHRSQHPLASEDLPRVASGRQVHGGGPAKALARYPQFGHLTVKRASVPAISYGGAKGEVARL